MQKTGYGFPDPTRKYHIPEVIFTGFSPEQSFVSINYLITSIGEHFNRIWAQGRGYSPPTQVKGKGTKIKGQKVI
jgi:hypothetical protein